MNKVVHFELPADDPEKAGEFYKKMFGWNIHAYPGMEYWVAHTCECDDKNMPVEKGAINGGFFKRQGEEKPLIIIKVPSLDDHVAKLKDAGCEITKDKTAVGEMGLYARFKDPEGNIVGLWQDVNKSQ